MKPTQHLGTVKVDESSFFMDFLYYDHTSYSKSLYPAITKQFRKEAMRLFGGGSWNQSESNLEIAGAPYHIKRVTFIKK